MAQQRERFELIFVNDGSNDDTSECVKKLRRLDPRIRLIELARNFGKEIAVTAGINRASGNAAITLDADLQHPPDLIPELIAGWRQGNEVVVGIRQDGHSHSSIAKRFFSKLFYRIMGIISETEVIPNATDYRLIDRVVIDEFNRFTERNRLTRGLIDWLGFSRSYVSFKPAKRYSGEATYSYFKLIKLALNSFVSMSLLPLRMASYLGTVIILVSLPLGIFIFIEKYAMRDLYHFNFSGPAILAVILLFLCGVIISALGIIALYIANIHGEVMNRPLYVARREGLGESLERRNEEAAEAVIVDRAFRR
jgi:dolichol-phosphate mannosyltransferase